MSIDDLALAAGEECLHIFGHPTKLYFTYLAAKDKWEVTVYAKLFGRRARVDLEIDNNLVDNEHALQILMAPAAEQIVEIHERDLLDGFAKPYFGIARNDTTGIVPRDGKYVSHVMVGDKFYELKCTEFLPK